jgi:DNA topoisomerase-1
MKSVVIVESPAKAETINKYLGKDYTVLASYGHIRDLPAKNGSVDPDHNFAMVWDMEPRAQKRMQEIARAVKASDRLILATDPDREGEAISWHVYEALKNAKVIDKVDVQRVVFNEITKTAILNAMDNPRQIDTPMVNAYLARRALDYLVGFTLSPVLWRKLPGSKSAGRVQSVALRLVCERESEIEDFIPQEYWSIDVDLKTPSDKPFSAHLVQWQGKKIDRLSIGNASQAQAVVADIEARQFAVRGVENKTVHRNPYPPFITSTLQQEASRKLGFTATRTMQLAQRLYEGIKLGNETVGLITYMRTDGVNLAQEAVMAFRDHIKKTYGDKYLPSSPRVYKSKSKNAQEAHEAIRPTDIRRTPESMRNYLDADQLRLYELIWKRALACQMESAVLDQVSVDIASPDAVVGLRAVGSVLVFDGFLKLYQEDTDDDSSKEAKEDADPSDRRLPAMHQGDDLKRTGTRPEQHFTKPPPRFTEASLVKKLEELGIGRPSTYASIIRILQERNYVRMDAKRFIPEDRGRIVTSFLTHFFERYVQYDFTANLETQLDDISDNRIEYHAVLKAFWAHFQANVGEAQKLSITEVIETLDNELGAHFFPPSDDPNVDPRQCPSCKTGRLGLKLGKFGAFLGCSNYPECKVTRQLKLAGDGDNADGGEPTTGEPTALGDDPESGKTVYLCSGPYGLYVQLGNADEVAPDAAEDDRKKKKTTKKDAKDTKAKKPAKPKVIKPKRASLPKGMTAANCTLDAALRLLSLPRDLGVNPETGEAVSAGLGRFGPYIKHGATFVSIKAPDEATSITLERAIEVVVASGKKTITLGNHHKKPITVQKGRFGYYLGYNKAKISLPKGTDPESVTLEQAIEIIESRQAKAGAMKAPKAAKAPAKATKAKVGARKK